MPTYDYECGSCRNKFELRCGFHEDPAVSCPECQGEARRLFAPVPIIFKGSGFYTTDHRAPMPTGNSEANNGSSGADSIESGSKSETTTADSSSSSGDD